MKIQYNKGFTLLEILLVIAAIGILAAIVIVAINPQRQLAQVREAQVQSEQNSLKNALEQYSIEASGLYPTGVDTTRRLVCNNEGEPAATCLDLGDGVLSPQYIARVPEEAQFTVSTNYEGNRLFLDRADTSELFTCPEGYIPVPGNSLYGTKDFCVMKYHAKQVSGSAISQPTSTPWLNLSQQQALVNCANVGADLMTNDQWMTIARNVEGVATNWTGGAVGNGLLFRGHNDNNPSNALAASTDDADGYFGTGNSSGAGANQRRTLTLSNGEVIWDFSGNVRHWLANTIVGTNKPNEGASGAVFQEWTLFADGEYGSLSYDMLRASDSSWNAATQGMGRYFAGNLDGNTYAFSRGGNWNQTASVGIYNLNLNTQPGTADFGSSFRCVITNP